MKKQIFILLITGLVLSLTSCNPTVNPELLPVLTTTEVTNITQSAARTGGVITSDAGTSVTERGVCWSTKANPTIADNKTTDGTGIGSFTSNITGLNAGQTYYIRAYATNRAGTGYGSTYQITTIIAIPTVTDVDGNVYHTINIGTQIWMVENLKTTKYNDGTSIPNVIESATWATVSSAAYCWYNNDVTNKTTYGALYNWYTVNTGKLAPRGWHVPTDAEWTILQNFLIDNGYNYDGSITGNKIAKSLATTTNWASSTNVGSIGNDFFKNNSSGFCALPGGYRSPNGAFIYITFGGHWWTDSEHDISSASLRYLYYDFNRLEQSAYPKQNGFSVRCVMD